MTTKFFIFAKKHFSIIAAAALFILTALVSSLNNTGLMEDGVHHFWEVLISGNIWTGHEGFSHFPFNSRYFPSIIPHLGTGLAAKAGILDIFSLVHIFSFVSYISPLIFLLIVYFNIPSDKKRYFDIILLSFLSCLVFMFYQIWTENLTASLFLWIVFAVYFYNDFDKLSYFNLFSLTAFSFALISSHPMTVVFIPVLLFIGIRKHLKTEYSSPAAKTVVLLSFVFLICAFIFNLYYIIHPIFPPQDYLNFYDIFKSPFFIRFIVSAAAILAVSFYNGGKYSKLSMIIAGIALINMFDNLIFNNFSSYGYVYRPLGFYFTLFFMGTALIIKEFKRSAYVKAANLLIMTLLFINCVQYAPVWNRYLKNTKDYLLGEGKITVFYDRDFNIATSQKIFFKVYHYHLHPFILLIIPHLYGGGNANYEIDVISQSAKLAYFYDRKITDKKENLKRFAIDADKIKITCEEKPV